MATTFRTKRIPQLQPAVSVSGNDVIVLQQASGTKRTVVDALKDYISADLAQARDIQLRKNNGYLQWRYAGDISWINLVSLEELQGPPGSGSLSQMVFTADGVKKIFNGISGIISSDALKCIVTVGGATQQPNVSYTVSTENGGSVIFDEAPPNNLAITVCVFQ